MFQFTQRVDFLKPDHENVGLRQTLLHCGHLHEMAFAEQSPYVSEKRENRRNAAAIAQFERPGVHIDQNDAMKPSIT